jgi:hypothetical protein
VFGSSGSGSGLSQKPENALTAGPLPSGLQVTIPFRAIALIEASIGPRSLSRHEPVTRACRTEVSGPI